ncbi:MAG TPA: inositol monophosphatase family protein, partial [Pararhizobium sp.]|nr:inositol monophosphatase family protein [Pararhizobium sp.]
MTVTDAASTDQAIHDVMVDAALAAGAAIMAVYQSDAGHREKPDCSPVTIADERAEAIICARLRAAMPGVPVVAEEEISAGSVPPALDRRFFLVDPLDGTKEFIHRRSDFTVNIALIEDGIPVMGVVHAPALDLLYLGTPQGAWCRDGETGQDGWRQIRVRAAGPAPVAVASRSHRDAQTDRFLAAHSICDCISVGSSLKFCLL